MAAQKSVQNFVAVVCIYGTRVIGSGWLVQLRAGGLFGDADPVSSRTADDAMRQALAAIVAAGVDAGTVRVFAAGGQQVADVELGSPVASYWNLDWQQARQTAVAS